MGFFVPKKIHLFNGALRVAKGTKQCSSSAHGERRQREGNCQRETLKRPCFTCQQKSCRRRHRCSMVEEKSCGLDGSWKSGKFRDDTVEVTYQSMILNAWYIYLYGS